GALALAAGTLCSAGIFLESIRRDSGRILELRGLMDNRQILMPFVNLRMLGKRFNPDTYQYHQLAIGVRRAAAADYVHALVTTLKTALIHPVVQNLPFDGNVDVGLPESARGARTGEHQLPGPAPGRELRDAGR